MSVFSFVYLHITCYMVAISIVKSQHSYDFALASCRVGFVKGLRNGQNGLSLKYYCCVQMLQVKIFGATCGIRTSIQYWPCVATKCRVPWGSKSCVLLLNCSLGVTLKDMMKVKKNTSLLFLEPLAGLSEHIILCAKGVVIRPSRRLVCSAND